MLKYNRGIILFIVLVLPLFIYLLLKGCDHEYNWLNYANNTSGSDTSRHVAWQEVPDPDLYVQDGSAFNWDLVKGKTTILSILPADEKDREETLLSFKALFTNTLDDSKVNVISLAPPGDLNSVKKSRTIWNKHNNGFESWYILSGDNEELNRLSSEAFLMNRDTLDLRLVLMDKDGHIRYGDEGYSISTDNKQSKRLIEEIKLLHLEYNIGDEK